MNRTVQRQQKNESGNGGEDGSHPEAQLTEVTVLNYGQDGGTAQEHGHLG